MGKNKSQPFNVVILNPNNFIPQRLFAVEAPGPGTVEVYSTYEDYKLQINLYNETGVPISVQNAAAFNNIVIGNRLIIMNIPGLDEDLQFQKRTVLNAKKRDKYYAKQQKGKPVFMKNGVPLKKGDWLVVNMTVFPISALYDAANKLEQQRKYYETAIGFLEKQLQEMYANQDEIVERAIAPLKAHIERQQAEIEDLRTKLTSRELSPMDDEAEHLLNALDGVKQIKPVKKLKVAETTTSGGNGEQKKIEETRDTKVQISIKKKEGNDGKNQEELNKELEEIIKEKPRPPKDEKKVDRTR